MLEFFQEKGVNALNNGLSKAENEILFSSDNITEIISLVLKGLNALKTECLDESNKDSGLKRKDREAQKKTKKTRRSFMANCSKLLRMFSF